MGDRCKDSLGLRRLWDIQECFLDAYESCRTFPSAKLMSNVDVLARMGIIGTAGGLETNPKRVGARREKEMTSIVRRDKRGPNTSQILT